MTQFTAVESYFSGDCNVEVVVLLLVMMLVLMMMLMLKSVLLFGLAS